MTASWWVSQEATEYKVVLRHRPRTLAGSPFDRHDVPSIKLDGDACLLGGIDGRKNAGACAEKINKKPEELN
jgi:hypothetical protein